MERRVPPDPHSKLDVDLVMLRSTVLLLTTFQLLHILGMSQSATSLNPVYGLPRLIQEKLNATKFVTLPVLSKDSTGTGTAPGPATLTSIAITLTSLTAGVAIFQKGALLLIGFLKTILFPGIMVTMLLVVLAGGTFYVFCLISNCDSATPPFRPGLANQMISDGNSSAGSGASIKSDVSLVSSNFLENLVAFIIDEMDDEFRSINGEAKMTRDKVGY